MLMDTVSLELSPSSPAFAANGIKANTLTKNKCLRFMNLFKLASLSRRHILNRHVLRRFNNCSSSEQPKRLSPLGCGWH